MAGLVLAVTVLFRPASAHVRAASLLTHFGQPEPAAAPHDETIVTDGALKARLYTPAPTWPHSAPRGLVLAHGIHRLGIDEPRLVRFARALAGAGVTVLTPEIAELADYHVAPHAIVTLGDAAHLLRARTGAKVGLMGMSFAGGLALLAAADPRYADDVGFVVAVGAHDDLARVSTFFATGTIERADGTVATLRPHDYGPLVIVYDYADAFFPPADVDVARDALRLWLWEEFDAARARAEALSPEARATMTTLFAHHVERFAPRLLEVIAAHRSAMAEVSPHGKLGALRVPVFLLHGAGDTVVPPTETAWLARDVPRGLVREELVSPALVHVELDRGPSAYDKWSLVHFMADVLEATDAN